MPAPNGNSLPDVTSTLDGGQILLDAGMEPAVLEQLAIFVRDYDHVDLTLEPQVVFAAHPNGKTYAIAQRVARENGTFGILQFIAHSDGNDHLAGPIRVVELGDTEQDAVLA